MEPFSTVVSALTQQGVRFVVIGVGGVNFWTHRAAVSFTTKDRDLFLPLDPNNLLQAWRACEAAGLTLWHGDEPLDSPRDRLLAEAIVDRRVTVAAVGGGDLQIDLTLVMAGFDFETVWNKRRIFEADGVEVPVADLEHIVRSKAAVGRPKDRLFLATHEEALRELLGHKP